MERENCLNKRMYDVSRYAEVFEIILISLGIFLVPLVVPQILSALFGETSTIANNSQIVVGTIVNSSLVIAGINIKGWKKLIGLITLPSVSALLSGLVFKTASYYILAMIPAIWLGNFAFIYVYKKLFVEKKINYILSSITGIALKVITIFAGFNLLLAINVIPKESPIATLLFSAMGVIQLITAALGSILAYGILKTVYSKNKS